MGFADLDHRYQYASGHQPAPEHLERGPSTTRCRPRGREFPRLLYSSQVSVRVHLARPCMPYLRQMRLPVVMAHPQNLDNGSAINSSYRIEPIASPITRQRIKRRPAIFATTTLSCRWMLSTLVTLVTFITILWTLAGALSSRCSYTDHHSGLHGWAPRCTRCSVAPIQRFGPLYRYYQGRKWKPILSADPAFVRTPSRSLYDACDGKKP